MTGRPTLATIKADLALLSRFETVLFGSFAEGTDHGRSDIDVAIITRDENMASNIVVYKRYLGQFPPPYELHVFELLPIRVKMAIVENHVVLHGDKVELSEYFYQTRKAWNDCKHRVLSNQFTSYKEKMQLMKNRDMVR